MAEVTPDISTLGLVSEYGVVPIYKPDDRWQIFNLNEVWVGLTSKVKQKYVPKVNDLVIDVLDESYVVYRVDHIDEVTLMPTLRQINPNNMIASFSETDVLFGVGPGTQADTYRVYLDTSVMPHELAVDARLKVAGTSSSYAKIFKSSNVGLDGAVISKTYDSAGNYISDNVPLEIVAIDSHVNHAIKCIPPCKTTDALEDGEVVTAVLYSDKGHVISKRQLLVENTSFIRSVNVSKKYVTHISIETPFISPTLDHVIEFPINVPIHALNIMGVVHYSDGSVLKLPVDGTKFRMHGLEQYLSTIVGQTIELVLSYSLSDTEVAYAGIESPPVNGLASGKHYVTEPYKLVTINPNNSYTVKLFGYPVWVNDATGYVMQFWMYNLDRTLVMDVTPFVKFNANTGTFDPKAYGYTQRKSISLNLRDVSGAFKPMIHTQVIEIGLNGKANEVDTPWTVAHEYVAGRPSYGDKLVAKRISPQVLNVSCGITELDAWRDQVYNRTYPLVDLSREVSPPRPTHFIVEYSNFKIEKPMGEWFKDIDMGTNIDLYKNVNIKFIKRTSSSDVQLSVAVMLIRL